MSTENKNKSHFMTRNIFIQFIRFIILNFKILVVMGKGHGGTK